MAKEGVIPTRKQCGLPQRILLLRGLLVTEVILLRQQQQPRGIQLKKALDFMQLQVVRKQQVQIIFLHLIQVRSYKMEKDNRKISAAKYVQYDNKSFHVTIDGTVSGVPMDDANLEYQLLKEWVAAGNTLADSD